MQRSGESIFLTIQFMVMGEGYHYESLHERWGTPWSEWSTIAGLTHRDRQPRLLTFKHTANLRLSVNLTSMSLDWGRKLENPGTMQRMQTPHRRTPAGQQVTMWNLFAVRQKSKPLCHLHWTWHMKTCWYSWICVFQLEGSLRIQRRHIL